MVGTSDRVLLANCSITITYAELAQIPNHDLYRLPLSIELTLQINSLYLDEINEDCKEMTLENWTPKTKSDELLDLKKSSFSFWQRGMHRDDLLWRLLALIGDRVRYCSITMRFYSISCFSFNLTKVYQALVRVDSKRGGEGVVLDWD